MMRHPEHHHHYQRNRPPPQRMLVSVPGGPHPGVLVSVPPPAPQMMNAIPPLQAQQPHQPPPPPPTSQKPPTVYYDAMMPTLSGAGEACAPEVVAPLPSLQQQPPPVASVVVPQETVVAAQSSSSSLPPPPSSSLANTTTSSPHVPHLANMKEKTPMCLVNELARYNKIQHQYKLTGEQGPAHKKVFTVTLKLGNEEYEAEGASIKKAQHSAAALALDKTQLRRPPPKTARHLKPGGVGGGVGGGLRPGGAGMVTPTVELNALAMKRGERTVYIVENGNSIPQQPQGYVVPPYYHRHNMYAQGQPRYNYDARRAHNMRGQFQYDTRYHGQFNKPGYQHTNGEVCTVRLKVGEREYPGTGSTIQAARHDAATRAIEDIKKLNDEEQEEEKAATSHAADENADEGDALADLNSELKSPISLVHEIALKRHLNVVFEVKSENGPPHMKVFVTVCKIADVAVEGEGHGKKISKKRAAEKMLQKLAAFPPLPPAPNTTQLKRKRIANKKKTRNLVKVNADKPNEGVEEINPISRLIQIQQANKEKEPVYTVVEERGAARRREFVIQASVNGVAASGVGPNKKLAKRAAAQALLIQLGYAAGGGAGAQSGVAASAATNAALPAKEKPDGVANPAAVTATGDKARKVTFLEEKQESPVGGSGGRQLVPGLLIVGDQAAHTKPKTEATPPPPTFTSDTSLKPKVTPQKITPPPAGGVRSKDKLMYLVQLMNIQAQFSDFPKANHEMYLTLVSLSTNPPQVCHGEGPTIEASHEKAALEALNVLSEMGLDNIVPSKEAEA